MTKPTAFGAAGDTLLAGGEAGAEAILPLKQFYDRLGDMLDKKAGCNYDRNNGICLCNNGRRSRGNESIFKSGRKIHR